MIKRTRLIALGCIIALLALPQIQAHAQDKISAAEARAIAKEAYIYGYPMVDGYRIQYGYFVDKTDPEYKGQWNEIHNIPRVYTPEDKAVQTPNSDTPYSFLGADLRTEPLVLTVPEIPEGRYYSIQFIDAYTFNFAYAGSRTTGNEAGSIMLAGPNWKGEKPQGIKKVIRSETEINTLIYRTQLFNPADLDNVKRIQSEYKVQPLSQFLGQPAPPPRTGHRLHQAAQPGRAEKLSRGVQYPEFRPAIQSDCSVREGTHGEVRRDWHRRRKDL